MCDAHLWLGHYLGPVLHPVRPVVCLINNARLEEIVRCVASDKLGSMSSSGSSDMQKETD